MEDFELEGFFSTLFSKYILLMEYLGNATVITFILTVVTGLLAACCLGLILIIINLPRDREAIRKKGARGKRATVVVLGDIGRSPRTARHAQSLADLASFEEVHVIAYCENAAPALEHNPRIFMHILSPPPAFLSLLPLGTGKILKAFLQAAQLSIALLLQAPLTSVLVLQLPPSVPTLAICVLCCRATSTRLLLDWHNFGYTLMALSSGSLHPLTWLTKLCEQSLGHRADASVCVTKAMQRVLNDWGVGSKVFYDKPPEDFRKSTVEETHDLFARYGLTAEGCKIGSLFIPKTAAGNQTNDASSSPSPPASPRASETLVTRLEKYKGDHQFMGFDLGTSPNRPAIIVSGTSWTPDEDFSYLLKAAEIYDEKSTSGHPDLFIIITGKGPMRAAYEKRLSQRALNKVTFCTLWLDASDYPTLLGSADLGVSLHTSSSGLDLPMKVVDMFGCDIPVCAKRYKCIDELVNNGLNGLLFDTSDELASNFLAVLQNFPHSQLLDDLNDGVKKTYGAARWDDEWTRVVMPLLEI